MAEQEQVPQAAIYGAAAVIAARLRERHDQIVEGRLGDVQTKSPNQIAEEALAAAYPAIKEQLLREVREALHALRVDFSTLAGETQSHKHWCEERAGKGRLADMDAAKLAVYGDVTDRLRNLLADLTTQPQQVDEEACERCEGCGFVEGPIDTFPRCPDCNGTGKKVAQVDEEVSE